MTTNTRYSTGKRRVTVLGSFSLAAHSDKISRHSSYPIKFIAFTFKSHTSSLVI